jgi:hypothetical protein
MTVPPTVFEVIVNGMVIPAGELEGGEDRVGHRPRGDVEPLAQPEVLKIAGFAEPMVFGAKRGGAHVRQIL